MCSIVASRNRDKLIELCKLNEYRGQLSHSISYYNMTTGEIEVTRGVGKINYDDIQETVNDFIIVHMQAPTTQSTNIHPAHYHKSFLWHNGIIKSQCVLDLQTQLNDKHEWDTHLLLKTINDDFTNLNVIDGSFSCLMYKEGKLYIFRNQISPLFIDGSGSISSTKFDMAHELHPDTVLEIDFKTGGLIEVAQFKTKNNPYYFGV